MNTSMQIFDYFFQFQNILFLLALLTIILLYLYRKARRKSELLRSVMRGMWISLFFH